MRSVWDTELGDKSRFTMDLKLTPKEKQIAKKFARSVITSLKRNDVYVHYLLSKLKENNAPVEIAAIPLVESGLNPNVQHGGAHGPWQYMRATGNSLGLRKSGNYDGVYDFFASTDAGIKYMNKLYSDLGDWELAVIAYNYGEYGVKKAVARMKKQGVENINPENLPVSRSSKNYLMRFKAFADILRNPEEYGVKLPEIKNRPAFRKVDVAGRISTLNEAAKLSGARIEILKKLNSGYRTDRIDEHHGINMPIEQADNLENALKNMDSGTVATNAPVNNEPLILVK
ncbi:MAG: lytic transglycosylase domain-containing protein, partial [Succinivibrio sp.]